MIQDLSEVVGGGGIEMAKKCTTMTIMRCF